MPSRRSALWSFVIALVGVLFLALPGTANAQTELRPGRIVGLVVDTAGTPVPAANVLLLHRGFVVARAITDREGKFEFPRVRAGLYAVAAMKPGVGHGRAPAPVRAGEVTRVRITLTRG